MNNQNKTIIAAIFLAAAATTAAISLGSQIVFADSGQRTVAFNDGNLHFKCVPADCSSTSTHFDNGQHTGER
jgi:hypothetical protein